MWGAEIFFSDFSATSCSRYCLSYTLVTCQHYLSPAPPLTRLKSLIMSSLSLSLHRCNSIWQSYNYRWAILFFTSFPWSLLVQVRCPHFHCLHESLLLCADVFICQEKLFFPCLVHCLMEKASY